MTDPDQLILKSLSGNATAEEQAQLVRWAEQSPENKKALEDFQRIWNARTEAMPDFDSLGELKKFQDALQKKDLKVKTLSLWPTVFKIAASVALVIVGAFLIYRYAGADTIVMASGSEKTEVSLPDGSKVLLNEQSKIAYTSDFAEHRRLRLSGEAFFEVTRNPEKPFVVVTDQSEVKVLGTSFNVRAFELESQNEVSVVTGKVNVKNSDNQTVVLTPGERAVVNNHGIQKEIVNPNLLAWRTKELIFRKASLAEVAETLERYFAITVTLKNPAIESCRFTSSFKDPALEEVTEAISIALNINIVHQKTDYVFDGEGCGTTAP